MELFDRFPHAKAMWGDLTPREFAKLTPRSYKAGELLMREGQEGDDSFFYILSGICEGVRSRSASPYYWLPIRYVADEFVGLGEIIAEPRQPRELSVRCKTPLEALEIDRAALEEIGRRHPELLFRIVSRVLQKSFDAREVIVTCSVQKTPVAAAYYLSLLYDTYRSLYPADHTGPVRISDTHQELCATLGCSKRTVDRYIADFAEEGLIALKRGKIHIDAGQRDRLRAMLDEQGV